MFISPMSLKPYSVALLTALGLCFGSVSHAASIESSSHIHSLMKANSIEEKVRLSPVRESALKSSAQLLGAQTGLIEMATKIKREVEDRRVEFEKNFRFGDMIIGQGVLPPVLLSTQNAAVVEADAMRLAGAIYHIKEPARFYSGAPSWRDWLLMGLPESDDLPELPNHEQLLPRDEAERSYWQQEMKKAYLGGIEQAKEIFDHNLSKLEETYLGMRTFYDLYQRGMVSAPIIASSQEIVTQPDANTIIVGDTLFRITMPAEFNTDHSEWKALQARPSLVPPLKDVEQYDKEQIKHAYETYRVQQARYEAARQAARWWNKKEPLPVEVVRSASVAPEPTASTPAPDVFRIQ